MEWEKTQAYVWGQILRNQEMGWGFFPFLSCILPFFCWVLLWSTHIYVIHSYGLHWGPTKIDTSFSQFTDAEGSPNPCLRALIHQDSSAGSMAGPDTAAEHADLTAGETSLLEGQWGLWPGFAHTQCSADRGKLCKSKWALSQGLLGTFTSLIVSVVYPSMATSRAAGTPPPPRAPPSHASGHHPSSWPSPVPIHPHPQAPT